MGQVADFFLGYWKHLPPEIRWASLLFLFVDAAILWFSVRKIVRWIRHKVAGDE